MEFNTLTDLSNPKSKQELDKHLRSFLDSIVKTKTFRIDTADFLERSCYVKLKQIAPNPQIGYNHSAFVVPAPATRDDLMTPAWSKYLPVFRNHYLERSCYVKLKQIAPNPQTGYHHSDIVHPAPATRDDLMTPAWSRYLPDLPKAKSPHGWVNCPAHEEEEAVLREKSDARNKIWHDLYYKKDNTIIENDSFWFNVMKKHRSTKSLHDVLLTRKSTSNDVFSSSTSSSLSSSSSFED